MLMFIEREMWFPVFLDILNSKQLARLRDLFLRGHGNDNRVSIKQQFTKMGFL